MVHTLFKGFGFSKHKVQFDFSEALGLGPQGSFGWTNGPVTDSDSLDKFPRTLLSESWLCFAIAHNVSASVEMADLMNAKNASVEMAEGELAALGAAKDDSQLQGGEETSLLEDGVQQGGRGNGTDLIAQMSSPEFIFNIVNLLQKSKDKSLVASAQANVTKLIDQQGGGTALTWTMLLREILNSVETTGLTFPLIQILCELP